MYLHFWKFGRFFASSLFWSHENIISLLRTWGLFYMFNNITTEKKKQLFVIFFAKENICDSWQQNENRRLKLFCSALCDPGHIFHVWMKQSFTIPHPHTSFHSLSNGYPLLWKSQGAHNKMGTSCGALSSHMSSRRAKGGPSYNLTRAFPISSAPDFAILVFF